MGTFTLTGRIMDDSRQPLPNVVLVLRSDPEDSADAQANELYIEHTPLVTDDLGYVRRRIDGVAAPGSVTLLTGRIYYLRSAGYDMFVPLTFTAPADGAVLDLADVFSGGGAEVGPVRDTDDPGLLLLGNTPRDPDGDFLLDGLTRDTYGDFVLIGA